MPSRELASKHYAEHDGKPFFPKLVDFLSSGAVVVRLSAFALLLLPSSSYCWLQLLLLLPWHNN